MTSMILRICKSGVLCFSGLMFLVTMESLFVDTERNSFESIYGGENDTLDVSGDELKIEILDSTYLDKNIFSLLSERNFENGSVVNLICSPHIKRKLEYYKENAAYRPIKGFRVRIFFDNSRDARTRSEEIEASFLEEYPTLGVYRSYENPYFKVTVGDLRTRSEAEKLLRKLEKDYPSAFIVREEINFPPLGL